MNAKSEIIKTIEKMAGKYLAYTIFRDWVECSSLAIQNACTLFHDQLWESREEQYKNVMKKYNHNEQVQFSQMFYLLVEALEENMEDVLGDVYMKSGCYSKQLGQFFTPFHVASLMSNLAVISEMDESGVTTVLEPSTGGGANIIALAKSLKEKGINYQKSMLVVAQDLDWLAVYMSHLQFSLLGIQAEVVQGDSICNPYIREKYPPDRVFITPARIGALQ